MLNRVFPPWAWAPVVFIVDFVSKRAVLAHEDALRAKISVIGDTFQEKVEGFKEQLITEALSEANGNQAKAARSLGLSYHQYRYFLKKYGH